MITNERAEEISKLYYKEIRAYCVSLVQGNMDYAEDIAQEVFLAFTQKQNELDDKQIKHWLMITANNKHKEHLRHLNKHKAVVSTEDYFSSPDEAYSTMAKLYSYSDADTRLTVKAIIDSLSEKDFELFFKKYVEEKSNTEIAGELGIAVSTLSYRLEKLHKKLEFLNLLWFSVFGQLIIKIFISKNF